MVGFVIPNVTEKKNTRIERGEEQNREEGEMAQKKLGGGRNRGKIREEGENVR